MALVYIHHCLSRYNIIEIILECISTKALTIAHQVSTPNQHKVGNGH